MFLYFYLPSLIILLRLKQCFDPIQPKNPDPIRITESNSYLNSNQNNRKVRLVKVFAGISETPNLKK